MGKQQELMGWEAIDLIGLDSEGLKNSELQNHKEKNIIITGFSGTSFVARLIAVGKDRITIRTISEDEKTNNKQLDLHLIGIGDKGRESLRVNQITTEGGEVLFQAPENSSKIEDLELMNLIEQTRLSLINKLLTPRINVMDKNGWRLNRSDVKEQCINTGLFDPKEIQGIVNSQIAKLVALNESE